MSLEDNETNNEAYLNLMYETVKELELSDESIATFGFSDSIDEDAFGSFAYADIDAWDGVETSKVDILDDKLSIIESYDNCVINRSTNRITGCIIDSRYFVILQPDKYLITITDFRGRRIGIDVKDISLLGRNFHLSGIATLFENQDDYVLISGTSNDSGADRAVNLVIDMSKSKDGLSRTVLHSIKDHRKSVETETNRHRITRNKHVECGDALLQFDCDNAIYIAFAGGHYLKFSRYGKYISNGRFDNIIDFINMIKPNIRYIDNDNYVHTDEFSGRGFLDIEFSIFKEVGDKYTELKNIDNIKYQHILPDIRYTYSVDGDIKLYNKLGEQIEITNSLGIDDFNRYPVDCDSPLKLMKFEYVQSDGEKATAAVIAIVNRELMYICQVYEDDAGVIKQADLRYYKDVEFENDASTIPQIRLAKSLTDDRPVIMIRSDEHVSVIDLFNKNNTVVHEGIAAFIEKNQAIYKQNDGRDSDCQAEKFVDIQFDYDRYSTVQNKFEVFIQDSSEYLGTLQTSLDE